MHGGQGTASDRAISALALVKVAFDHDASFLSYFEPFLEHCLLKSPHEVVSIPDLKVSIDGNFGLKLPQAVIKTLLRRQETCGHVVVRNNTCEIERNSLKGADLDADQRKAMRQQAALIDALIRYARKKGVDPWPKERAQRLLLEYVEHFSARLLDATMSGSQLPAVDQNWEQDQLTVHAFVLHAEAEDPDSFELLTVLVKGKMLTDAIFLGEPEILEGVEPLERVEVYLDTPILLRILGYAGDEMAVPYLELLTMLKRQKAIVRCFDRNVTEAEGILSVAEREAQKGSDGRARRDIVAHLADTSSPSDIALKSRSLASDLLKLGIQPVELLPLGPRQVNEATVLARLLKRHRPRYPEHSLKVDVDALVTVHQLRGGGPVRALPKCRAVFVTRNYPLYKVSREFFEQRDPGSTIPTCIPMSAFTTMVWVREPLSAPDLPPHRLIADACAATRSNDEEMWKEINQQASELRASNDVSTQDAHNLRVHGEAKHALREDGGASEEPYLEGSTDQVRQRSEEWARAEAEWRRHTIERVAKSIGGIFARILFALVIPLICIGIIFGPLGVLGSSSEVLPSSLQWIGTAIFGILSLLSFIDGVSLGRRVRWVARVFEERAVRIALRRTEYSPER